MSSGWVTVVAGGFRLRAAWSVAPGQVLVLFGPSGSGKTLTLRAIAGLITPAEGHIEVGGVVVYDSAQRIDVPAHQRRAGYVPQDWLLFPHLDVAGNIAYGLRATSRDARRGSAVELLQRLRLEGLERRRPWELSGGQQQRVALARALAPEPSVLLLDEPFSALDLETRREVRGEVRSILRATGLPVLLVTHDREEALAMGDSVIVLDQGRVIAEGSPLSLLGHPSHERVARLVGVENLLRLEVQRVLATDGTAVCVKGDFSLEVPNAGTKDGAALTIGIRADDILLASAQPAGLSARNILQGRVLHVDPIGALYAVTLDCSGVILKSHVTSTAIASLAIAPGVEVWAIIKASSCFIAQD